MPDKVVQGVVVAINYSLSDEDVSLFEHSEIPGSYLCDSGAELFPEIEQT